MDAIEGGTEWEARTALADAENELIAAGIDPTAFLRASRRHTEAIRNMMQTVLVPSFERALGAVLEGKLGPLVQEVQGLRGDVHQSAKEASHGLGKMNKRVNAIDKRLHESHADRQSLHNEIAGLSADVADIKAVMDARPQQRLEERERYDARLARLETRLTKLDGGDDGR
jgi:septal ring factor EnvC (AmiA/AmiB activator)